MDKTTNRVNYFIENNLNSVTGWVDSKKLDDYQLVTNKNNKIKRRIKLFASVKRKVEDNTINKNK